jgi:ABC-type branched-subunit amino acid transport system substrate-binding protein
MITTEHPQRPRRGCTALAVSAALAVAMIVAGCSTTSSTSKSSGKASGGAAQGAPIKIGVPNAETGASALPEFSLGLKAYVDDWNKRGGFKGRPIQLVVGDLTGDPSAAAVVGQKLINQDKVVAMVSTNSNLNCTSNGALEQSSGVPVLYNSVDPTCAKNNNVFGFLNPSDQNAVPAAVALMKQGATKIAALFPQFPGVEQQAKGMQEYAASHGGTFTAAYVPATATQADFDAAISTLKRKGVDGVFVLAATTSYATVIQSARNQKFFVQNNVKWIYGPTLYTPSSITAIPQLAQGGGILTQTVPFEVASGDTHAIYQKLLAANPHVDGFSALAWNTGASLEAAFSHLKGNSVTRSSLLAAFRASTSVRLPLSTVVADLTSRSNPSAGAVVGVKNGKFVVTLPFFQTK